MENRLIGFVRNANATSSARRQPLPESYPKTEKSRKIKDCIFPQNLLSIPTIKWRKTKEQQTVQFRPDDSGGRAGGGSGEGGISKMVA